MPEPDMPVVKTEEIEVTPDMIRAGSLAFVLCEVESSAACDECIQAVYIEMEKVRRAACR